MYCPNVVKCNTILDKHDMTYNYKTSLLRTQNSEILFNIILCYCSLGYIRYKRKVDNAVDM